MQVLQGSLTHGRRSGLGARRSASSDELGATIANRRDPNAIDGLPAFPV